MITNAYAWLKLLHLFAVFAFVGNVSFGMFWMAHAVRSADRRLIAHALDGIMLGDRWFMRPGVILIIAAGMAAAIHGGVPLLRTPWVLGSVVLFVFSGMVFGMGLAPLQRRIRQELATGSDDAAPLLRRWRQLAYLAVVPLWLAIAMMVLKWPA